MRNEFEVVVVLKNIIVFFNKEKWKTMYLLENKN